MSPAEKRPDHQRVAAGEDPFAVGGPVASDSVHHQLNEMGVPVFDDSEPLIETLPFPVLPGLDAEAAARVEAEALRLNDRYLDIIEGRAFCPYARQGRERGHTSRYVYHADSAALDGLFELMAQCAEDPAQEVIQIIMPRLQVEPDEWSRFCHQLTRAGHHHMGRTEVLACAPLHPALPFSDETPFALVPLFRRAPQPTVQWVRLDALRSIYKGQGEDRYVDQDDLETIKALLAGASQPPIYDRVCEANAATVARLGVAKVVAMLNDIAADASV